MFFNNMMRQGMPGMGMGMPGSGGMPPTAGAAGMVPPPGIAAMPQGMPGGAGMGGLGSLASLLAHAGANSAPGLPPPGQVPQSGPTAGPIPPLPQGAQAPPAQQQGAGLLDQLLRMDPSKLQQMFGNSGLGGLLSGAFGGGGPGPGTGGLY